MTDFIFMVESIGQMYITGPDVVRSVTGEDVSHEDLGGAGMHATTSGVAHYAATDEDACYTEVRRLLGLIPSNNASSPPIVPCEDPTDRRPEKLASVIPDDPNMPYDVLDIIEELVDDADFMQVHAEFARNIVVGFGRMNGSTVGIVANQPNELAGVLDIDASDKGARFVRFCDAFNIPILTLVDVPGFMPGTAQEQGGIIRHGAKMLYAYSEATVPKITVILRKAYGGAYIVMGSKELRCDVNLAWPTAEIAVMGPDGAVNVIGRREISAAEDPDAKRQELVADYRERFANPYVAANRGYIDDVIDPRDTRTRVIDALGMLANKVDDLPPKKTRKYPPVSNADRPRYAPNTVSEEEFVKTVSDMAREVWDFHNRWGFGSGHFEDTNPAEIINRRKEILAEEIRELSEAIEEEDTTGVLNEAADVLFVAIGHVEALGHDGLDGVRYVTNKNANKTEETHAIRQDTGKLLPKQGKPHKWA